jgi:glucosamine-6-phosphate deaminase
MRLIILEKEDLVGEWSAKYVVKRINEFKANENRYFVLGLPTGMQYTAKNVCQIGGIL